MRTRKRTPSAHNTESAPQRDERIWYADWLTYAEEPLNDEEAELVNELYLGGDPGTFFPAPS